MTQTLKAQFRQGPSVNRGEQTSGPSCVDGQSGYHNSARTAAAKEIKVRLQQVLIILFSMHESNQLIREAKVLGVQGYVNKSQAGAMLLNAVDAVASMQTFFPYA